MPGKMKTATVCSIYSNKEVMANYFGVRFRESWLKCRCKTGGRFVKTHRIKKRET